MYCQECGKEIKDSTLYCPYCGVKQEDIDSMGHDLKSGYDSMDSYNEEPHNDISFGYNDGTEYGEETGNNVIYHDGQEKKEYCPYCGKILIQGKCDCAGFINARNKGNVLFNTNGKDPFLISSFHINTSSFSSFITSIRDMTGMSEPSSSSEDPYEHDIPIVPDCIEPEENEIVIKQYNVAKLRTRLKFMKAEGRMMVTNRRLLFRAAGTSLTGNILQEHQFNIDEIGGVELHKDYKFSLLNVFLSLIVLGIAYGIVGLIFGSILKNIYMNNGGVAGVGILFTILAVAGLIPTFIVYKRFWLKLFSSCISLACAICSSELFYDAKPFYIFLFVVISIILLVNAVIACFVPNLVIKIKTKSAAGAVVIGCQKTLLFRKVGDDYSGFTEVLPWEDTVMAINELGTIIDDLQKQGDYAIEKWAHKEA